MYPVCDCQKLYDRQNSDVCALICCENALASHSVINLVSHVSQNIFYWCKQRKRKWVAG